MQQDLLIKNLQKSELYNHNVKNFELLQTHLSWVILTGDYAYKIKKPVNFGFVDFETLDKREFFCNKEFELNQLLASNVYIEVLPIYGSFEAPSFDASAGEIIEYAIKMNQFEQADLFGELEKANKLSQELFIKIGEELAKFHQESNAVPQTEIYGSYSEVEQPMLDNFTDCKNLTDDKASHELLNQVEKYSINKIKELKNLIISRKQNGFIHECHGDLHLGNIAMVAGKVTVFDCIDFNESFRKIDVINDIAFLAMDLYSRGKKNYANVLINSYFEQTKDYEGVLLLNFYMIYRAMVRAKVALLTDKDAMFDVFQEYLNLAASLIKHEKPTLFITHGVSGSGKSIIAKKLAINTNGLVIRSDALRNKIELPENIEKYSAKATDIIYNKLFEYSSMTLDSNVNTIIDATFLNQTQREQFLKLAQDKKIEFKIISCTADDEILEQRINDRLKEGADPSEANIEVLQLQQQLYKPLTEAEEKYSVKIDTTGEFDISVCLRETAVC